MRKISFIIFLLLLGVAVNATHNRAGEITYKHLSGLSYEFTLVTYTYTGSPADRPSLVLDWGDNTSSNVQRISKTQLPNYVFMNVYKGTHTFNGQGTFVISMFDPNRNGGVVNIINSINEPFYIETTLIINPFIGGNNSATLLNPPIDNGCVGSPFYHNAGAYDIDGDSIAYELVPCRGTNGGYISSYNYPAASMSFSIDPITGTLSWLNPMYVGEYNVAFLIKEYRAGQLVSIITRDMQITIAACNNNPPVIESLKDTCIEVGQNLNIMIKAYDIDNDHIILRGTGGPLLLSNSPAVFNQPINGNSNVQAPFSWTPICEHVQLHPYQMVFKVKDNGSPVNLVDIKTLFIKVIAPSPKNLTATPKANTIELKWNKSYCTNAKRFDIYRHNGYTGYIPSNCETGVPAWTGYVRIGRTNSITDTSFIDNNNGLGLKHGLNYCYMVVAHFKDSAESYASLEACASLIKDVPVITNVSVDNTSNTHGKISLAWSKPNALDLTQTPGPFKYHIYHNTTGYGQTFDLIDSLSGLNDTIYFHKDINTENKTHFYKIGLVNNTPGNWFIIGNSHIASSIFINTEGKANKIKLSWNENVPWQNDIYVIYKERLNGMYDSIGVTNTQTYTDSGLVNGATYCYIIKSIGKYSSSGFTNPLINFSQRTCDFPIDKEAPCPPKLWASTDCRLIENYLIWNNPNNYCANDVVSYKLYYKSSLDGDYSVIQQISSATDTTYLHSGLNTIVGCYYVTAIDSFDNESVASNMACIDIDSCRLYRLPNVFTPNADGFNDYFTPFPYDFVEEVQMSIFNRWGGLVFKTTDPDILWDGKDITSKNECTEGVYFYVCEVFERRLEGIKSRTLHGTVSLYR